MKNRLFTLCAAIALTAASANAQWAPSDTNFTIVGQDSIHGQGVMKTLHAPDGSIILTWINTPKNISYKDPSYGRYLYMQIFDASGNPKLGKNGKIIVGHPTLSYSTDYGLSLTDDGKIVIGYSDTRTNPADRVVENYLYCYDLDGNSVWDKDGIKIQTTSTYPEYQDAVPLVCTSGGNIYASVVHTEEHNVKADSTNWTPNPFDPDGDEMPDSVSVSESEYQLMRFNADGTYAWSAPLHLQVSDAWFYPAPNGNVYMLYVNKGSGMDARLIDKDGKDVWENPVNVESGSICGGFYTPTPAVEPDGKGGLMMAYRKLLNFTGYVVINRLSPDGTTYSDELIANGTQDGDGDYPKLAVNGDKSFVAFAYKYSGSMKQLYVNQFDNSGDYTWEGDSLLGFSICDNYSYGVQPVKTIPVNDGWVVLYGDLLSYNTANFYIQKIGLDGSNVWQRRIGEEEFKSSGFSVTYDDDNAYIFYTCDREIGPDYKEIPDEGGMRVMCVSLKDAASSISRVNTTSNAQPVIYNAQGVRVSSTAAPGLYIVKENGITKKVIKK